MNSRCLVVGTLCALPEGSNNQSKKEAFLAMRVTGTRPSRLRSLAQADDARPNQMSTSNRGARSRYQGSTESGPTVMTHPHLKGLTVRTHVKSEHGSDGSGSGRTPGSVNIRVWKVRLGIHLADMLLMGLLVIAAPVCCANTDLLLLHACVHQHRL